MANCSWCNDVGEVDSGGFSMYDEPVMIPCLCQKSLVQQIKELNAYLDNFGIIAGGNTLVERVHNVVQHYATQMGRWVKKHG